VMILVAAWLGSFCATVLFLLVMYRREPDYDPDYMCPNCVTPWKCNGPHIAEGEKSYVEPEDGVQPADPYLVTYQGLFITGDYKWTAMQ